MKSVGGSLFEKSIVFAGHVISQCISDDDFDTSSLICGRQYRKDTNIPHIQHKNNVQSSFVLLDKGICRRHVMDYAKKKLRNKIIIFLLNSERLNSHDLHA